MYIHTYTPTILHLLYWFYSLLHVYKLKLQAADLSGYFHDIIFDFNEEKISWKTSDRAQISTLEITLSLF